MSSVNAVPALTSGRIGGAARFQSGQVSAQASCECEEKPWYEDLRDIILGEGSAGCGLVNEAWQPEQQDAGVDADVDGDDIPDVIDVDGDDVYDVDADGDTVPDEVEEDGDVIEDGDIEEDGDAPCLPGTFTDTDFTAGTATSLERDRNPGSILLPQNWTYQYHASSGLLPSETIPAWTLTDTTTSGVVELIADPVSGEPSLHMSSVGSGAMLYFEINPSFNNSVGWVLEWRCRVEASSGSSGGGSSVYLMDGSHERRMGQLLGSIFEVLSSETYIMDTTSAMHTYRFESIGNNVRLFVDDGASPVIDANFTFAAGGNFLQFNDTIDAHDGETYWSRFYYYVGGDTVPYVGPGTYVSEVYDTTSFTNNIGSGANITIDGDEPAGTTLAIETRTGNTTNPDDGTWSTWQAVTAFGRIIQSPMARRIQVRIRLSTTDPVLTPQLNNYTVNYCTY